MFEDLRKEGEASPFFQQGDEPDPLLDAPSKKKKSSSGGGGGGIKIPRKIFGMTPGQRFAVSLFLLIMTCFGGFALLLVLGAVVVF